MIVGSDDVRNGSWTALLLFLRRRWEEWYHLWLFLRAVFPVLKWQEWENDKKLDKFAKKFKLPLLKFGVLWHNRWEGSLAFCHVRLSACCGIAAKAEESCRVNYRDGAVLADGEDCMHSQQGFSTERQQPRTGWRTFPQTRTGEICYKKY